MTLFILAKSLQIAGFVLASIFGLILFEKNTVGRLATRLNIILKRFKIKIFKMHVVLLKPSEAMLKLEAPDSPVQGYLGATFLRGLAIVLIMTGLIIGNSWILWIGVAIAVPYVLIIVYLIIARPIYLFTRHGKKALLLYLITLPLFLLSLASLFVIDPIILLLYMIVFYLSWGLTSLVAFIASGDYFKKAIIIAGSFIVLFGLILELIAAL